MASWNCKIMFFQEGKAKIQRGSWQARHVAHVHTHTEMTCSICAVMACHNGPGHGVGQQSPPPTAQHTHNKADDDNSIPICILVTQYIFSVTLKYTKFLFTICMKMSSLLKSKGKVYRVTSSFTSCWDYLSGSYIQANENARKYFTWAHNTWMCVLNTKQTHTVDQADNPSNSQGYFSSLSQVAVFHLEKQVESFVKLHQVSEDIIKVPCCKKYLCLILCQFGAWKGPMNMECYSLKSHQSLFRSWFHSLPTEQSNADLPKTPDFNS